MKSKSLFNLPVSIWLFIVLLTSLTIISCKNQSKPVQYIPDTSVDTTQRDSLTLETDTSNLSVKEDLRTDIYDTNKITIGTWIDDSGSTYELYKIDNAYYLDNHYYDGSFGTDHLRPIKRYGKRGFVIIDDEREFYLIKNGNLYVYDMFGDVGLIFRPI